MNKSEGFNLSLTNNDDREAEKTVFLYEERENLLAKFNDLEIELFQIDNSILESQNNNEILDIREKRKNVAKEMTNLKTQINGINKIIESFLNNSSVEFKKK